MSGADLDHVEIRTSVSRAASVCPAWMTQQVLGFANGEEKAGCGWAGLSEK